VIGWLAYRVNHKGHEGKTGFFRSAGCAGAADVTGDAGTYLNAGNETVGPAAIVAMVPGAVIRTATTGTAECHERKPRPEAMNYFVTFVSFVVKRFFNP